MTDPAYRAPVPSNAAPAYNMAHTLPNPQQSQVAPYAEQYGALATTRAGLPDPIHGVVETLPPATAPEPLPRSCVEGSWKFE